MSTQLKLRRGTTAQHSTFTGASGEITIDTSKKTAVVHDGTTAGGVPLATEATVNGKVGLTGNETVAGVKTFSANPVINAGTANGVAYLNGSKVLTTGSALTFDGSQLDIPAGTAASPSLSTPADVNTGLYFPAADTIGLSTNGAERLRLDSSGNLGLGVTPSAWSGFKAFQIGAGSSLFGTTNGYGIGVSTNAFYNGTNWRYGATAGAMRYELDQYYGHSWFTAPSGTAGNAITFTQAMTLDSSGNLLVGTPTAAAKFTVAGQTSGAIAQFSTDGFSSTGTVAIKGHNGAGYNAELYLECPGLIGGWVYVQRASSQLRVSCGSQTNGVSLSNGGSSWGTFSDERLKDIIEPITDAAAKVSTLRPVIGKYKTDADGVRRSFLIAQDVQAVLPEAVYQNSETDDTLNLSYTDTIPLLVAAIKEQQAIIQSLTARITALEGAAA